jgi:hypothetical protein
MVRWQRRIERTGIFGSFVAGQKNNKDFGIVNPLQLISKANSAANIQNVR